ncbi:MAG: 2-phosphosulfolactate phosphatase family protein [Cyanobacteria bacterium P01_E01_bin.48]
MDCFVYHTPELTPDLSVPPKDNAPVDCAIVVDVLRATTTIATALSTGAEAIQAFADLDRLKTAGAAWEKELCILSGERGGNKVAGFDLGNSPLDYSSDRVKGKRIFMSTTNGTRALQRVQHAPVMLTAALVNVGAIVKTIIDRQFASIWIVNSGWQGDYSLEDTVCAGALLHHLQAAGVEVNAGNDEAIAAIALYKSWSDNLLELLRQASHGQRLLRLQKDADLEYCAAVSTLDIVPYQSELGVLMA